jgi:hypothetical protein
MPAVLQFGAPTTAPAALSDDMPAVLQFAPSPTLVAEPSAMASVPAAASPALQGPVVADLATPPEGPRATHGGRRGLVVAIAAVVGLLGLGGAAIALGWVVLPGDGATDGSTKAEVEASRDDDAPPGRGTVEPARRGATAQAATNAATTAAVAEPTAPSTSAGVAAAAPSAEVASPPSSASAAPTVEASAPPPPDAPPEKDATLLSFQAHLTVSSSIDAEVVVQGVGVGRTNQKLLVRCGPRNVRLRDAGGAWLSEGTHAQLECMHHTRLTIAPSKR